MLPQVLRLDFYVYCSATKIWFLGYGINLTLVCEKLREKYFEWVTKEF